MLEDDDTFPDEIKDPRKNLPDLSIRNPADGIKIQNNDDLEPDDPSESLPSASEAFEKSPRRSVAFLSILANVKIGVSMIMIAVFLYSFTNSDPRHSAALFTVGMYFLDRAWKKYKRFR